MAFVFGFLRFLLISTVFAFPLEKQATSLHLNVESAFEVDEHQVAGLSQQKEEVAALADRLEAPIADREFIRLKTEYLSLLRHLLSKLDAYTDSRMVFEEELRNILRDLEAVMRVPNSMILTFGNYIEVLQKSKYSESLDHLIVAISFARSIFDDPALPQERVLTIPAQIHAMNLKLRGIQALLEDIPSYFAEVRASFQSFDSTYRMAYRPCARLLSVRGI